MSIRLHQITFLVITCLFFLASCQEDNEIDMLYSETLVQMEAEGGEAEIQLIADGWSIVGVINKKSNLNIFGDIYTLENQKVRENDLLKLDGLGRLEAFWIDKGFSIMRSEPNSLTVILEENSTGEAFNFVILLQDGQNTKEIVVEQEVSQGYSFENIEYYIGDTDGDSLYLKRGTEYKHNLTVPNEVSVSPFGGINIENTSYFESGDRHAFVWLEEIPVEVDVPYDIRDGNLHFSGEKRIYGEVTKTPYDGGGIMETIVVAAGVSSFYTEQEWRTRTVSYSLNLSNNRTGEKKTVHGKWVEVTPTGRYEIVQ